VKGLTLLASTISLGILLGCSPAKPAVEVRDVDDGGRVVQRLTTDSSGTFRLLFTHSMYGGTVSETYRVDGGTLERSEVRTENGGAAEYYAPLGNFHQEGADWVVDAGVMRLPRLYLSVTPIGKQAIAAGNTRIELGAIMAEGHIAELVAAP